MTNNDNIMVKISRVRVDDNILAFNVIEETKGFADRIHQLQTQYFIKKQELIEDFIYKNLETNILETMKVKIENELLDRKLKDQTNERNRKDV